MKRLLNITCIFHKHLKLLKKKLVTFLLKVLMSIYPNQMAEWAWYYCSQPLPPSHLMSSPSPLSTPLDQELIVWSFLESPQSFPPASLLPSGAHSMLTPSHRDDSTTYI